MMFLHRIPAPQRDRWVFLLVALAALWPGLVATVDFHFALKSAQEDGNELTAFGLMLSGMPFALLLLAWLKRKDYPVLAIMMMIVSGIGVYISSIPAWFDGYNVGLGPYTESDVDYLEWYKIAIWMVLLLLAGGVLVGADLFVTYLLRHARHQDRDVIEPGKTPPPSRADPSP